MLAAIHTFSSNTSSSTYSSPTVFYFCQRIKQCGINFLLLASLSGISISLLMKFASSILQQNKANLIALSRKIGAPSNCNNQQEENEDNGDSEMNNKNDNKTMSDSLMNQYSNYMASSKKPWIFRVIDECSQDGSNFGKNVFDQILLNFAYFSSSSSSQCCSSSNQQQQRQQDPPSNPTNELQKLQQELVTPSSRAKFIFSSVTKYFASRFAARILWACIMIGIEKSFSRIVW